MEAGGGIRLSRYKIIEAGMKMKWGDILSYCQRMKIVGVYLPGRIV